MSFVARDFAGANVLISNLPSKSDMYGEPFVNVSLILIIIHSSQKKHLVPWFTLLQNGKKNSNSSLITLFLLFPIGNVAMMCPSIGNVCP